MAGVTRDELENELAGRSTLNQRHKCADLPPSWRFSPRSEACSRRVGTGGEAGVTDELKSTRLALKLAP